MTAKLVNLGSGRIGIETDKGRQFDITAFGPTAPDRGWTETTIQLLGLMIDFFAMENYTFKMNLVTGDMTITRKP